MEKLILFCLLILVACGKENKLRKTDGLWNVHTLRIEDGEGFTYLSNDISGEFSINYLEKKINCYLNFSYKNIQGTEILDSVVWNQLDFDVKNESYFVFQNNGTPIELRIMLNTKKSLMAEYYDTQKFRLTRFVLKK